MRMTPRIVGGARYRHLQLELFVVRAKNVVGDRPIRAYAIARIHFEVGGVQTRSKRGPVHRSAAHALTAVVGAQCQRILSAGDSWFFPVEFVGARLVRDPVALCIPKWTGLQRHDLETGAGQPLQQHATCRATADDKIVDLLAFAKAAHGHVDLLQRPEHVAVALTSFKRTE